MVRIYQHAAASDDLVQHFVYPAENASMDIADRFLANAEESFDGLVGVVGIDA